MPSQETQQRRYQLTGEYLSYLLGGLEFTEEASVTIPDAPQTVNMGELLSGGAASMANKYGNDKEVAAVDRIKSGYGNSEYASFHSY